MAEKKYNLAYESLSQMEDQDETAQRMERLFKASLCVNCKHQGDCMFLLKASNPIIECELHECGLASRPRLTVVKQQARSDTKEEFAEDNLLGLCGNCDNLRECMLPKHPSGVWHCEEYS